jgi:hypothetical protein
VRDPLLGKFTKAMSLRFLSPKPIERITTATIDQRFGNQCIRPYLSGVNITA